MTAVTEADAEQAELGWRCGLGWSVALWLDITHRSSRR